MDDKIKVVNVVKKNLKMVTDLISRTWLGELYFFFIYINYSAIVIHSTY